MQNGTVYLARHGETLNNLYSRHMDPSKFKGFMWLRTINHPFSEEEFSGYLKGNMVLRDVLEIAGMEGLSCDELDFGSLTSDGFEQAERLRDYMLRESIELRRIRSSSMSRAINTAGIVGRVYNTRGGLPQHPELNEIWKRDIPERSRDLAEYFLRISNHRDLVVAHKHVNASIAKGLGYMPLLEMANCGLAIIDLQDGRISNLEYVANSEM